MTGNTVRIASIAISVVLAMLGALQPPRVWSDEAQIIA